MHVAVPCVCHRMAGALTSCCLCNQLNRTTEGGGGAVQPLPWSLRLRIVTGAARGLAFLHSSEKHVIYRDFKASNILLDTVRAISLPRPAAPRRLIYDSRPPLPPLPSNSTPSSPTWGSPRTAPPAAVATSPPASWEPTGTRPQSTSPQVRHRAHATAHTYGTVLLYSRS
jgi:hypothetical protein